MSTWRQLTPADLPSLLLLASQIHPTLPESPPIFTERLHLFPQGCLALTTPDNQLCGYAISHPILSHKPPALDSLLGEIGPDAESYYIHDVAILPGQRGRGVAAEGIRRLIEVGEERYATTCLVSVYGTSGFWARFGFEVETVDAAMAEKLREYGEGATYMVRQNRRR